MDTHFGMAIVASANRDSQATTAAAQLQALGGYCWKENRIRFVILLAIVSVSGLIGHSSQREAAGNSKSNDLIFKSYEFPSHPNLAHLCQQRVYGSGHEITWDAFASFARPSTLVDYYHQKLGDAGFTKKGEGASWGLPADAPRPKRVLDIMAIGTKNPSRTCEKSPPSNSRAIIMLSRMN